jgi:hypothetical protein
MSPQNYYTTNLQHVYNILCDNLCLEKKSELVSPSLTPPIQQITTCLRKGVQGLCPVNKFLELSLGSTPHPLANRVGACKTKVEV